MENKKRFVSLKAQIILSTIIPVIICLFIISSLNSYSIFNSLNDAAKAEFTQIGQKYAVTFEDRINNAMNYLSIVASIVEFQVNNGMTDRENLQKEILKIFSDYNLLDASNVYFEANMYDGKDADYIASNYGTAKSGRISWCFYVKDGKIIFLPEAMEDDREFDLPHYTNAKKANKPIYTDPVKYEIYGRSIPLFTLTYPIRAKNGDFIGAVTADLFLEDMYKQLQNEKIYETGYITIVSNNGKVIYSPNFEDIGSSREEAGLDYALPPENESRVFFNANSILNNKKTLVSVDSIYIPSLESRFFISVAAPVEEINAAGLQLTGMLVMFSVFAVIAVAVLLYWRVAKITAPLKDIADNVDKIAGGDYDTRITGNYLGELAIVKDSVNAMADSIEAYVEESDSSLNILKNILNGLGAYVYVTIPESGEVLFINERMKRHYGIEGDGTGQYCYKIFQTGMDQKCDFCPCFELDQNPDKTVVWEEHNPASNRFYQNTDCYIDWPGGFKVHLQHSVDITDMKKIMGDKLAAEHLAFEMKHEKEKAEDMAKAKNDFLAKMSHEIRTPMNAVMGMSEIMLRKNLPHDVYENALVIKSASSNLLSIINDILDITKIESGMMEIVETEYLFPSLINDVVGIIRVRLIDKPVQFVVDAAPNIPSSLIGDEVRMRQMLINLLSNAVKYTNEGHISLRIKGDVGSDNTVKLNIAVADSGIGIRDEDKEKLFSEFVQIDTVKNKGIIGTGLGLAISRNLARMMGGDITVESEYGKGSTFTVTIRQRFEIYKPLAVVNNPERKAVLLYEPRQLYKDSLISAFEELGVEYQCVESMPELFDNLENYHYVFLASFLYGSINPALSQLDHPPRLVLLSDITESFAPKDALILTLPAYSLSVANILDNIYGDYGSHRISGASFIAPEAKVLVVDDVVANLKVCEGLLLPYEIQLTLCANGPKAVELAASEEFDLIFMDHMMPEMDGLDVTRRIREMEGEYFQSLPIVALTANAVLGIREMFIQNGMNDFLSKPIETTKLDMILEKWLPKEKQKKINGNTQPEEESGFVNILKEVPELSVDKALSVVGGSSKTYERIVKLSVRLLPENIARLESLIETSLPNYSIEVHGIKGVLNNIGAYALGAKALELEELSKKSDIDTCRTLHLEFIKKLTAFSDTMQRLLDEDDSPEKPAGDIALLLLDFLPQLEEAADFCDNSAALKILSSIDKYTYGQTVDNALSDLTSAFERFEFDEAMELLDKLKGGYENG